MFLWLDSHESLCSVEFLFLFSVKKGDRIAQLICERIYIPELQVEEVGLVL